MKKYKSSLSLICILLSSGIAVAPLAAAQQVSGERSEEAFIKEIEGMVHSDRPMGVRDDRKISGTPGSPDATTTIEGNQLPPMPDETFGGKIERNALQSTPWWPPRVVPPKGAPNVLLIMTDDSGLRCAQHLRRRDPDTGARSHRQQRPALHQLPFHGGVLGDACGTHHRAQPSPDGLRHRV